MTEREIREALDRIFDADAALYRQRGFMRRIGFGKRPALLNSVNDAMVAPRRNRCGSRGRWVD